MTVNLSLSDMAGKIARDKEYCTHYRHFVLVEESSTADSNTFAHTGPVSPN